MSLLFNVSQLLKSDVGQLRRYDLQPDGTLDLGGSEASDVHGHARFMLTNFGLIADIHAEALVHSICARCLEPFSEPTTVDFEEEYRPVVDIATGLPAGVPSSDEAFEISANHTIDLGEAIRQQLLLTLELVPVCRNACRGLCPACGVNLNLEQCTCPPSEGSTPFTVLQGLLANSELNS